MGQRRLFIGINSVTNDTDITEQIPGLVKWFDPVKGFGFVVSDHSGPDILLHVNVLRNFGQNSVADNARILVAVQNTERGVQAVEVLSIDPPSSVDGMNLFDIAELDSVENTPLEPGRVKWFDKGKGFSVSKNLFTHVCLISRFGNADCAAKKARLPASEGSRACSSAMRSRTFG